MKICLILALLVSHAYAEESYSGDISLQSILELEGVVAATKKLKKTKDSPGTVLVITQKEIHQRGYQTLNDILADLPGMETIENYFAEQGTLIPVRGLIGNNKILVMINSIIMNPPGRENMPFRSDLSVLHAKRVEIVYGPGSSLYGTDAVSAIINIVTNDKLSTSVTTSLGQQNHIFLNATTHAKIKDGSINIMAQYERDDGVDIEEYNTLKNSLQSTYDSNTHHANDDAFKNRREAMNVFGQILLENSTIQYNYRGSKRSSADGYGSQASPILLYSNEAIWGDHSHVMSFTNEFDFTRKIQSKLQATYNRYELDSDTEYVFASGGAYFYDDDKYARGRSFDVEEQVFWQVNDKLLLTFGAELRDVESIPKATVAGGYNDKFSFEDHTSSFTYTQNGVTKTVEKINEFSYRTYGYYLQAEYDLSDKMKVYVGSRYNRYSNFDDKPLVSRSSLIYYLNKKNTLKLNYAEAFVAPSPYFSYNVFDNGSFINISNPNLRPEESKTYEINYLYEGSHIDISSSVYFNKVDDVWVIEDDVHGAIGTTDSGKTITQTLNNGESKLYGIDTFVKYQNKANFYTFLNLSYVDGKNKLGSIEYDLERISKLNLRLGVSYIPMEKLLISPSLSYRTNPEEKDQSLSGNAKKSYSVNPDMKDIYRLDIHTRYTFDTHNQAFLDIDNLTDNKYTLRGLLTNGESLEYGLSVKVGYQYKF